MAIWCGQCQARNEGTADTCAACGAALRANDEARPRSTATHAAETSPPLHEAASIARIPLAYPETVGANQYKPRPYDNRWLVRLLDELYPGRCDLARLVARCKVAVRCEVDSADLIRRDFFLPERPGRYLTTDEESYVLAAPGLSCKIVLVTDAEAGVRAVYCVERARKLVAAPEAAMLAQLERLKQEAQFLNRQLSLLPLLVCVVVPFFLLPSTQFATQSHPAQPVAMASLLLAAILAVFSTLYLVHLRRNLADCDDAIGETEDGLGLPKRVCKRTGLVPTGFMVAFSTILIWLAARVLSNGTYVVSALESFVVVIVGCALYPVALALARLQAGLAVGQINRELRLALAQGRIAMFEPWVAETTDFLRRGV